MKSISNWPAALPSGGSRGWPLAGIAQTASWAGRSGGSTCSCAPHCPGNQWDDAERCSNALLMCKVSTGFWAQRRAEKKVPACVLPTVVPSGSTRGTSSVCFCGTDGCWLAPPMWILWRRRKDGCWHRHTGRHKASSDTSTDKPQTRVNTHSQNTQDQPMEKRNEHLDIYDSPSVKPRLMIGRKRGQNLSETYQTQHLGPWCSHIQLLDILHEKRTAKTRITYQTCNLLIRIVVLIYKAAC